MASDCAPWQAVGRSELGHERGKGERMIVDIGKGTIVCTVGGGGKTHLTYLLAEYAAQQGLRVVVTTTTKIQPPDRDSRLNNGRSIPAIFASSPDELLSQHTIEPGSIIVLATSYMNGGQRLVGVDPALPHALITAGIADCVMVESDGARMLPLKAFGPAEPVIAQHATDIVTVAGLDALGAEISDSTVFRPELVRAIAGGPTLSRPAFERVVRALDEEAARQVPTAKRHILLNKADLCEEPCGLVRGAWIGALRRDGLRMTRDE
ncbi:putative selenium-dependent hydroxylase accessory protein YqeC [Carpediemonas membranifera]|uniref:Putative selenium-dependent hydroxylase accessory protein YqeC n=1 Tax=Carpediemonas membranifera TaxID=201153 RepID=A0A8J6E7U5_9EUKA|nr:putative selenium-dependent hydroxylase accessory protein YqeC [Carpediemonas membranifera]|eukprot:KAG9391090.1 putative selenium-dependent hydroxylase accessory protein YqeC [Carpediemonas membranifera]